MDKLADISVFENLQAEAHKRMSLGSMSMFNREVTVENATFWRDGQEVKVTELDQAHPDKAKLEHINELENNVAGIITAFLFAQLKIMPKPQLEKLFEQITLETNVPPVLQEQIHQLKQEATALYQDRAIATKAETPWLDQQLSD